MNNQLSAVDIICNAFDREYNTNQAVDDYMQLMNEYTMLEVEGKMESPRFIELQKILPMQERLMQAKLRNDSIFDKLGTLELAPHKDA